MNGWVRLFAALVLGLSVDIKFVLGSSVLEVQSVKHGRGSLTACNNMAFLHADADSHCIYGMQRYGPTEHAVALWGHEIAFSVLCTLPFSYA